MINKNLENASIIQEQEQIKANLKTEIEVLESKSRELSGAFTKINENLISSKQELSLVDKDIIVKYEDLRDLEEQYRTNKSVIQFELRRIEKEQIVKNKELKELNIEKEKLTESNKKHKQELKQTIKKLNIDKEKLSDTLKEIKEKSEENIKESARIDKMYLMAENKYKKSLERINKDEIRLSDRENDLKIYEKRLRVQYPDNKIIL